MALSRAIVYYTDSQLDERLAEAVRTVLRVSCGGIPIISVSQQPLDFGRNVCVGELPRERRSMYYQILEGLRAVPRGMVVNLCEHDVFYQPTHFDKLPDSRTRAYFNRSRFYYSHNCDTFLQARGRMALSQGVAYRKVWVDHAKKRLAIPDLGRMRIAYRNFNSGFSNIDVRHSQNQTSSKTGQKAKWLRGRLRGVTELPGWGTIREFQEAVGYRP
jgi:hypothetical protein